MMRRSAGKDAKAHSAPSAEDSDLPRKCVVIKKKKIGENVEKIELRYVAYNKIKPGTHSTTMEVINDASTYFKERAGDLDYEKEPDSESWAKTVTVQKSEEKGKKKLEECLPILVSIRERFAETEKNKSHSVHKRTQSGVLKSLCDEIISEAMYVLQNSFPVTSDLIKKIANINTLSRQIISNESKLESLVQDENELAASKSKTSDKYTK